MRFAVATAILAVVATAGAKALTKRQVAVSNPASCLTATTPVLGTIDIITCSTGTCTTDVTATQSILGEDVTFTVGVRGRLCL